MRKDAWSRFGVCLIAGVAVTASPLSAGTPAADSTYRSGVELVALNVVVTDARQRFVSDLGEQDFEVLENGVAQPIAFFGSGSVPLDVALLIDTSGSMDDLRPIVQRAAAGFLRALRPGDRGAVIGFNHGMAVLQEMTGDIDALTTAIRRAGASGSTALYTALYVTLREFGRPGPGATEIRRQAIVVLTDGGENRSALPFELLQAEAQSRGVAIYAILLQDTFVKIRERLSGRLSPTRAAIKDLAVETGALAYFPERADQLAGVYDRIAAELSNQYSIAYLPRAEGHDGTVRKLDVRVTTKPTLRTRTRTHYLPSTAALQVAARR